MRLSILLSCLAIQFLTTSAQTTSCDKLNIQLENEIERACGAQVMTMTHDQLDRPYLYVANKEAGLTIYSLNTKDPQLVGNIPINAMDGLEVMGVSQFGNRLFLALGNFFSTKQASGMAIVDVADPTQPKLSGLWKHSVATEGAALVLVEGDFAYVAAFSHGVIVLNISNPDSIKTVGQIIPALNFPDMNPDASKINARGMVLENDVLFLCYDAGGIRIINVADKANPKETGRYSNPVMNGKPRAYNNVAKKGNLLYVGVDYCGVEIIDVSDTSDIKSVSWWNPWECHKSPLNWFSSNGHVNEVQLDSVEMKLFVSSGKGDLHVLDVSDPSNPDSCTNYGGISNGIGTWGVSIYKNQIFLSYICTLVPFSSNWSGVKILSYQRQSGGVRVNEKTEIQIYPNPVNQMSCVDVVTQEEVIELILMDVQGRVKCKVYHSSKIQIPITSASIYWLKVRTATGTSIKPLLIK